MTDLAFGSRITLEPGVRYEWDRRHYHAWSLLTDYEPTLVATPEDNTTSRGEWLPMVSARIAISTHTTIRAAVTRTIARPDFSDLAPMVFGFLGTISFEGNPTLRSTSSWNADVMLDQELARGSGRLSPACFASASSIRSTRASDTGCQSRPGISNPVQPRNGDRASLTGLEIGYSQRFRFLPGPWAGLGLTASYTLSDSSAIVPGRVGDGSVAIFPDRPGHDVDTNGAAAAPRQRGRRTYDRAAAGRARDGA